MGSGSFSQSYSESQNKSTPTPAGAISPITPLLNSLFGFGSETGKKSGLFELSSGQRFPGLGGSGGGSGFTWQFVPSTPGATPTLGRRGGGLVGAGGGGAGRGPNADPGGSWVRVPTGTGAAGTASGGAPLSPERFGVLADLLDLPNLGAPIAAALLPALAQGAGTGINLLNQGANTLSEGLNTGFRTDLQPIIAEETRRLYQEILPQIGQNFIAMNEAGPFSSDLTGQVVGAGRDLASQLGALQVQADEAAAGRRANLIPLSRDIASGLTGLPEQAGQGALNLGSQLILEGTPAGRAVNLLQLLSGQVPTGAVIRGNRSEGSSKGIAGSGSASYMST